MRLACLCLIVFFTSTQSALAQSNVAAEPIVGLRDDRTALFALVNADVVVEPGQLISDATILVRGTLISAVGQGVEIPAGYEIIDCQGKRIYPGLIDAWSESEVPIQQTKSGYWNQNVTPQRNAAQAAVGLSDADKLRSQGITVRVVAPRGGIVKGSSSVVLLDTSSDGRALLTRQLWQHLQMSVPRSGPNENYPNSPMGATALLRQAFHDAQWYHEAWAAYHANPQLPRPETNLALDALSAAIRSDTFVIDAPNERMAIRADNVAKEFSLRAILRGSGREYRELASIVAANRPILLPVDFPEAPNVNTSQALERVELRELMHWDLAPENPARLAEAGVRICLTTDGLDDVKQYLNKVRIAVNRGLPDKAALAAMTTTPAALLGIEKYVGRIQVGKLANLAIADGDLFDSDTKVTESWVAGKRFPITKPTNLGLTDRLVGEWSMTFQSDQGRISLGLEITQKKDKLEGVLRVEPTEDGSRSTGPDRAKKGTGRGKNLDKQAVNDSDTDQKASSVKLENLASERDRVTAKVNLRDLVETSQSGVSLITLLTTKPVKANEQVTVLGSITLPNGQTAQIDLRRIKSEDDSRAVAADASEMADQTDNKGENADGPSAEAAEPAIADASAADLDAELPTPRWFPLGAYGLEKPIQDQPTVLFRGATLWTCEDAGLMADTDLLVRDGIIVRIGANLDAPPGCEIVEMKGKHITPGLIDCHSHMATDGGVNESGQAVTAEVRIGDFIDNSDIHIYRQLAGGLTTSNILHGSANPIGGQNQVIKLRWGETMDGLRMKEAPQGIKFALGENVKRNQLRYPNTRMGVEQILRDQLLAAREYQSKWRRWREGVRDTLPPRVDLQLEALSEVQLGTRWIHCHSYRQDEIIATLDVLEEFGIQIGTLQHILEGYKVADRMAQHGAMGSAFSDWWAYKFEVFDAIPYNGALMHERGVVVSFNSDDRELARHMNTEAAKATKYGGVSELDALKFVTLNPARQLRIEQYVGSLKVGKHADLAVWSDRPLSTLSRCEQTWIDGRLYFDLESDSRMRARDQTLRARLIQKVFNGGKSQAAQSSEKPIQEEDRWVRHDAFCTANGDRGQEMNSKGDQP